MWPDFCEISSNSYDDIVLTRFSGHCLLWPWPLTFWNRNLISTSMSPNTVVTKIGWNSLRSFLRNGVQCSQSFQWDAQTQKLTHGRTDPTQNAPDSEDFRWRRQRNPKWLQSVILSKINPKIQCVLSVILQCFTKIARKLCVILFTSKTNRQTNGHTLTNTGPPGRS